MPTNEYSQKEYFSNELIGMGGKVICYVGLQERPVIEYQGEIYEQRISFGDERPCSMSKVINPERVAQLRGV